MASALQQVVASIQNNNYVSLAIITAVGYDYVLTFPREIEYIWKKPWTWVSILFLLIRYCGLCYSILLAVAKMEVLFFLGLLRCMCLHPFFDALHINGWSHLYRCNVVYIFGEASLWIFQCAAESVMILRIWALYNRSKLVLGTLLTFYIIEQSLLFVYYIVMRVTAGSYEMSTAQVLQYSLCVFTESYMPRWLQVVPAALQIALGTLMCLLTTVRFVQELLQTYKATKRVQFNRYTKWLMQEAMIYFIVVLFLSVYSMLINVGIGSNNTTDEAVFILGALLENISPVVLVPRFILNLRELYARDVQASRRSNVDTGFGLGSGFEPDVVRSMIAFADPSENEGGEQGDELEIQEVDRTSILA